MNNKTIGEMISALRKEQNLTQVELAKKLNITDKAVSKWERNISCPDISLIPQIAKILDVSTDELLNAKKINKNKQEKIINTILIGIGLAMGITITVLSILKEIDYSQALAMLGIGLSCLGIYLLNTNDNK